jgi:hypothetical protein
MVEKTMLWFVVAAGVALATTLDMRRLAVNRVGLSRTAWLLLCAGAGPFAGVVYLVVRRAVWRDLVGSVWTMVGDGSHSVSVRRKRLVALRKSGLIGAPVFRHCLALLEAGCAPPPAD